MLHDHPRHDVSEVPETSDIVARQVRDAARQEAELFSQCPSAFWLDPTRSPLEPGHGGSAPSALHQVARALPRPPQTPVSVADVQGRTRAYVSAALSAGPIFITTMCLMALALGTGVGRDVGISLLIPLITLPFSVVFGAVLGSVPILAGIAGLSWLGRTQPRARRRWCWAAVGSGLGLGIAGVVGAGWDGAVPLVLTSAACATIAHRSIRWNDPQPA